MSKFISFIDDNGFAISIVEKSGPRTFYIYEVDNLKPAFGRCRCWRERGYGLYVQKDLPGPVKISVALHEISHAMDIEKGIRIGFWGEVKANLFSLRKYPWGWIRTFWLSLISPYRWKFYFNRIFGK